MLQGTGQGGAITETVVIEFDVNSGNLNKSLAKAQKVIDKFKEPIQLDLEVNQNISGLTEDIDNATDSIQDFGTQSNTTLQTLTKFAGVAAVFYGIGKAMSFAFEQGKEFVNTAAEFEQFETTLTAIQGSAEEAEKSMTWIKEFAVETPFELNKVTEAFVKMTAYGLDPMSGTLSTLGDAASAMGKDVVQAVEAMADAITGENERLKEFGIKAKKDGDKIAYSWADSSGKSRNIVIQNNKDIIESTLNAIFNEKYAGAMMMQAKTWNGIMSNMADSWTNFKAEVMDAGLFEYLKAIAMTISDFLGGAFDDAKDGAKDFSLSLIEGIKGSIQAVGNFLDIWSGVSMVFDAVKVAFYGLVVGIGESINIIASAWDSLWVGAQNTFKAVIDSIGEGFSDAINYMITKINELITAFTGLGSDLLEFFGFEGIKETNIALTTYTSGIETATKSTEDLINLDWSTSGMNDAYNSLSANMDDILNESGLNKANKIIQDIELNLAKIRSAGPIVKPDAIGDLGDVVTKETKKASKAIAKAGKDAKKAMDKTIDSAKKAIADYNNRFADGFFDSFDAMLHGDLFGSFEIFFGSISDTLMQPFMEQMSESLSGMMSNMTSSMGSMASMGLGAAVGLGLEVLSGLMTSSVSQEEIDASKGQVEFTDESLQDFGDVFETAQIPLLEVTNKMYKSIRNMDENFYSIAKALTAGSQNADITGSKFTARNDSSFMGWSTKTSELIGSGLTFAVQDLNDVMDAGTIAAKSYTTVLVEKTKWWGGAGRSYLEETYQNLPPEVLEDMADAFSYGYETILTAGLTLGLDQASLTTALNNADVDLGKIDFEGLSAEEVNDRLNQAFSGAFTGVIDQIGGFANLVDKYQRVGEEALGTISRIAVEYEQAAFIFRVIGKEFNDILRTTYTSQQQILDIVESTGGLENFNDAMSSFMTNFYTDAEQLEFMNKSLDAQFTTLGIQMPKTNAEFRTLLETMDTSSEESAYLYGQVLLLSEGFAEMTAASDELNASINDIVTTLTDASLALQATKIGTSFESGQLALEGDQIASLNYAVQASQRILQDTIKVTDIYGVQSSNYLDKFDAAVQGGLTDQALSQWEQLGSALLGADQAAKALTDALYIINNVITTITDSTLALQATKIQTGFEARQISLTGDQLDVLNYAVKASKEILEDTIKVTDIYGVHSSNYLEEFDKAVSNGLTAGQLSQWDQLGKALQDADKASQDLTNTLEKQAEDALLAAQKAKDENTKLAEQMINNIADAWLGNLSYLNLQQKADFASGYLKTGQAGDINTVEAAKLAAEFALNSTQTKEEYIPVFEKYIDTLEKEAPESTLDDVVYRLDELISEVQDLEETQRKTA